MSFLLELLEKIIKKRYKHRRFYKIVSVLACIVVFTTTYALILPAITIDSQTAKAMPGISWRSAASEDILATGQAAETEPEEPDEASNEEETEPEEAGSGAQDSEAAASEVQPEEEVTQEQESEDSDTEEHETEDASAAASASEDNEDTEPADADQENEDADMETDAADDADQDEDIAAADTSEDAADTASTAQQAAPEIELITEDTTLTAEGSDYKVYVTITAASKLPKDTRLQVREITRESDGEEYQRYFDKAQEELQDKYDDNTSLSFARFYDISFVYEGVKIEPAGSVTVRIEYDRAVEMEANASVDTIHFDTEKEEKPEFITSEMKTEDGQSIRTEGDENGREKSSATNLAESSAADGGNAVKVSEVEFESDKFSVYGIVGTTIEDTVLASDGRNYEISVTYGADAGIPAGSSLEVEELVEGAEGYDEYVAETADAVGSRVDLLTHVRIFDIRIEDADGSRIEPNAPVEVKIEYADPVEIDTAQDIQIVHFGSADTEVIDPETNRDGDGVVDEFVFETGSFSYYSIVSQQNPSNLDGKSYVLITAEDAVLLAERLSGYEESRLQGMWADPDSGKTIRTNETITVWTFEAVEGNDGWYYISDGNGNYLNLTDSVVTLGEKQPVYVGTRPAGEVNKQYQLRTQKEGGTAVNNYGHNWKNGFGPWTSGEGGNEWFRLYEIEYLGEIEVSFDKNGGSADAPSSMYGIAGNTITLPDYTGTKDGYTFIGWSTNETTRINKYYPLYPAGSEYTIPDSNTTLYAVWSSETPPTAEFYIRLDGTIPYEPDQYDASAYTGKISINEAIKNEAWVTDNDATKPNNGVNVINDVTANLNKVPTVDQLVKNINASHKNLGFMVENVDGEIVVSKITYPNVNAQNYNVSEGDALYVLWYVQKYAGSWHVDGALLVKDRVKISYNGNAPDGTVKNVPLGYQEARGTEITIGASGSKTGIVKTPTRTGYNFLGWNTQPDGSGDSYSNNDIYTLNEDTTLYAQWSKGTNYMTVSKINEDDEALAGAEFKLEEKTESGSFIEKAQRTTGQGGIFTYDSMENDTLYRLTETYAPNGYEVQNSFFFKVDVGEGQTVLDLHVCDENGNIIETPEWLTISYTPAGDSSGSGVARIKFVIKDERIERNITFIKTDREGNPLSGAVYALTNSKGAVTGVLKEESDTQGVFSVDNATLSYGEYTLTETTPPANYKAHGPVVFTLNDYVSTENTGLTISSGNEYASASCEVSYEVVDGLTVTTYSYTVTTVDDPNYASVILKKIGYNNTDGSTWDLAGATFKIYSDPDKKNPVELDGKTEFTSDEQGLLYEGALEVGTYYLDETVVPAGYNGPAGMYILNVTDEGVTLNSTGTIGSENLNSWISSETDEETQETTHTVSIRNVTGVELPSTGGPGTRLFAILGGVLTVAAGVLLAARRSLGRQR